jgi:hypothetical protein
VRPKKKVIARQYLPVRPPLFGTATVWLLLDRLGPPAWVQGAVWCFVALLWVGSFMAMAEQEHVSPAEIKGDGR